MNKTLARHKRNRSEERCNAGLGRSDSRKPTTICGVVLLNGYMSDGRPDTTIVTDDDEEYRVCLESDTIDPELYVDCVVEATGWIQEIEGETAIYLKRIRECETGHDDDLFGGTAEYDDLEDNDDYLDYAEPFDYDNDLGEV